MSFRTWFFSSWIIFLFPSGCWFVSHRVLDETGLLWKSSPAESSFCHWWKYWKFWPWVHRSAENPRCALSSGTLLPPVHGSSLWPHGRQQVSMSYFFISLFDCSFELVLHMVRQPWSWVDTWPREDLFRHHDEVLWLDTLKWPAHDWHSFFYNSLSMCGCVAYVVGLQCLLLYCDSWWKLGNVSGKPASPSEMTNILSCWCLFWVCCLRNY